MKRQLFALIGSGAFLLLPGLGMHVSGQVEDSGQPLSWELSGELTNDPEFELMPGVDNQSLLTSDALENELKTEAFRFATSIPVNYTTENSGHWINRHNGDRLWMLGIRSTGAVNLGVVFSNLDLPKGASVYVYNSGRTDFYGPLTSENNCVHHLLGMSPLEGEEIIVEYYEPKSGRGKGSVDIAFVSHGYREILGHGSVSKDCMEPWDAEAHPEFAGNAGSVFMILTDQCTRLATGVMVNNTSNDGTPYMLTSSSALLGDPNAWVFVNNTSHTDCTSTDCWDRVLNGAEVVAIDEFTGTALLQLLERPRAGWQTYFSGWDFSAAPMSQYGCLHYGGGNFLGLAYTNLPFASVCWNQLQAHRVGMWKEGTTGMGSVGAPLLDASGRVRAIFVGGYDDCQNNGAEYFGLMELTWDLLAPFLDPLGEDNRTLDGQSQPLVPTGEDLFELTRIYPNPADQFVYLTNFTSQAILSVDLLDSQGQLIRTYHEVDTGMGLQGLPESIYLLRINLQYETTYQRLIIR